MEPVQRKKESRNEKEEKEQVGKNRIGEKTFYECANVQVL